MFMFVILTAQALVVIPQFEKINIQKAYDDSNEGLRAVEEELDAMMVTVTDYAIWDDTYFFTLDKNKDYVAANFTPNTLANLNLTYVGILNDSDIFYSLNIRGDDQETAAINQALTGLKISQGSETSGFLTAGEKTYMFAARQIQTTDMSKSSDYYFIFMREYRDYMNEDLGSLPSLSLSLLDLPTMEDQERSEIEKLFASRNYATRDYELRNYTTQDQTTPEYAANNYNFADKTVYQMNDNYIGAYTYLINSDAQPFAVLKSETDNSIIIESHKLVFRTYIFVLSLGLILTFIISLFVNRSIIRPVNRLKSGMDAILVNSEAETIISRSNMARRNDEIGDLTNSFLSASEEIKVARTKSQCLNEQLETMVQQRTEALESANKELLLYGKSFEETSEGLFITDLTGNIVKCNRAYAGITGYAKEELYGKNPRILKSGRHPTDFYKNLWNSLRDDGKWEGEIWDKRKNNQLFPAWMTIDVIREDNGMPAYFVGVLSDLTEMKEMEIQLERMAYYDVLTGLANRVLFEDHLQKAIAKAQRYHYKVAVVYIDLDGFNMVNDTFGHRNGDFLLKEMARRIRNFIRETDLVSRLGGDEFSIVLEGVKDQSDLVKIANSLLIDISRDIVIEGEMISISGSIGIAMYPEDGTDVGEILKKADAALHLSKMTGKNCYSFASNNDEIRMIPKIIMINRLKKAIERTEFNLLYQPQFRACLNENAAGKNNGEDYQQELFGAEALIRWQNDKGSIYMPDEFIELAEESGLIIPVGEWVIEEACATIREMEQLGRPVPVSVNVSIKQFKSKRLVEVIKSNIRNANIAAEHLFIEITESIFAEDEAKVICSINELKDLGIQIVLDDFGKGYSSLGIVSKLPFDFIKIDKVFIQNAALQEENNLATTILTMAEKLNMRAICEGVETREQLEYLLKNGASIFQGFYFSKPLPKETYINLSQKTHDKK
jgi:diguanylate cyclase (GGDEF)-like protein/PAS domain S-box-containing protein